MSRRAYKVVTRADELLISVRFLRPAATAFMLTVLALFWSEVFYSDGPSLGLIMVFGVTSCVAFLIGFASSWVLVTQDSLTTYSGPIPVDRSTRDPTDIEEIFCTFFRSSTGRGVIERYSLMATIRFSSGKPVTILAGFTDKSDAAEVAMIITRWLNDRRPARLRPVVFRNA